MGRGCYWAGEGVVGSAEGVARRGPFRNDSHIHQVSFVYQLPCAQGNRRGGALVPQPRRFVHRVTGNYMPYWRCGCTGYTAVATSTHFSSRRLAMERLLQTQTTRPGASPQRHHRMTKHAPVQVPARSGSRPSTISAIRPHCSYTETQRVQGREGSFGWPPGAVAPCANDGRARLATIASRQRVPLGRNRHHRTATGSGRFKLRISSCTYHAAGLPTGAADEARLQQKTTTNGNTTTRREGGRVESGGKRG